MSNTKVRRNRLRRPLRRVGRYKGVKVEYVGRMVWAKTPSGFLLTLIKRRERSTCRSHDTPAQSECCERWVHGLGPRTVSLTRGERPSMTDGEGVGVLGKVGDCAEGKALKT